MERKKERMEKGMKKIRGKKEQKEKDLFERIRYY